MRAQASLFALAVLLSSVRAYGATEDLSVKLSTLRGKVLALEAALIDGVKMRKEAHSNLKKIQSLIELQKQERVLSEQRLSELSGTLLELEARRAELGERVAVHSREVRLFLAKLWEDDKRPLAPGGLSDVQDGPVRKVLARLASRGLKEVEALKIDLQDADQLERHIQQEQAQLAYVTQDLQEQESVLKLNQIIQLDLLKKNHDDRIAQLEDYRKFKSAESHVEGMLEAFNSRMELERAQDSERSASREVTQGAFESLKGKLPLPLPGAVLSQFGKSFDPKSNLHIFKKGVDIAARANEPVRAISSGRVAYSGELPTYGRVAIIDHGEHFYSLCAHLGELRLKVGDHVNAGDWIGDSDDKGTPVYFEIRARNIPVNPLQWVSN